MMLPEKQIAAKGIAETLMPMAISPATVQAISNRKLRSAPTNSMTGIEVRQMPNAAATRIRR
jgi:hypothetical protein